MTNFSACLTESTSKSQIFGSVLKTSNHDYYGEFILFLTVENYQTADDIIQFFSTDSGPNLHVVEIDENIPFLFYFRYAEDEIARPRRFVRTLTIQDFLKQTTECSLKGCRIYLEDDKSPEKIDMNRIHLVLKDSNDNTILNTIFQDPSNGNVILREEDENQNMKRNDISNFEHHPTFPKIKND